MAFLKLPSQLPLPLYTTCSIPSSSKPIHNLSFQLYPHHHKNYLHQRITNRSSLVVVGANKEDIETQLGVVGAESISDSGSAIATTSDDVDDDEDDDFEGDPDPQDLEYVSQIKRVLELLKKNRDMLFSEVKLTVMIEDPREVERRRLLGIDDIDAPTRDDLANVLEEVNEGKIPRDRAALQMLAEEMVQWPNLEVEAMKKGKKKIVICESYRHGC